MIERKTVPASYPVPAKAYQDPSGSNFKKVHSLNRLRLCMSSEVDAQR